MPKNDCACVQNSSGYPGSLEYLKNPPNSQVLHRLHKCKESQGINKKKCSLEQIKII